MDELTAEVTAILASGEPWRAYHWLEDRWPGMLLWLAAVTAERDELRARLMLLTTQEPLFSFEGHRHNMTRGWWDCCVYCGAKQPNQEGPFPHTADCVWARAREGWGGTG